MSNVSILVVDDEPFSVDELVEAISEEGYGCLGAGSADEALQILSRVDSLKVVLSDVKMPEKSGLDLLHEAQETAKPLKFIFMSGHTDSAQEANWFEQGVVAALRKPIDLDLLFDELKKALAL